jgi:hypothetical protein
VRRQQTLVTNAAIASSRFNLWLGGPPLQGLSEDCLKANNDISTDGKRKRFELDAFRKLRGIAQQPDQELATRSRLFSRPSPGHRYG